VVICLERGADLHTAQLMPLPPTVSRFSKIQIGFTFLVPAYLGSSDRGPLNVCVCVDGRHCMLQIVASVWRSHSANATTKTTDCPPEQSSRLTANAGAFTYLLPRIHSGAVRPFVEIR